MSFNGWLCFLHRQIELDRTPSVHTEFYFEDGATFFCAYWLE